MVRVPAGRFLMGSPDDEPGRLDVEGPQRWVSIATAFDVSKFAITLEQFEAFVRLSGYLYSPMCQLWDGTAWHETRGSYRDPGFAQTRLHPAVCVSWTDAQAYVAWLRDVTGRAFRLLAEAEWEYAARAGSSAAYWWGPSITPDDANANASKFLESAGARHTPLLQTAAVDRYAPNPWGLYQMHGNTWEWVEDCYAANYVDAPSDSSARTKPESCPKSCKRVLRGGGWMNGPHGVRCARRHAAHRDFRRSDVGFRIAASL